MTTVTNLNEVLKELAFFMRNKDIFTVAERGVSQATATGTFSSDTELLIAVSNVKNVRSVTVAGTPLTYGTDYAVDNDYDDSGTIKCRITFTNAQSGAYSIPYDYGDTDIIMAKMPQNTINISDMPKLIPYIIGAGYEDNDIRGDSQLATFTIGVVCYHTNTDRIMSALNSVHEEVTDSKKAFYNLVYVRPLRLGALLPYGPTKNKVFQRSLDLISTLNEEIVS